MTETGKSMKRIMYQTPSPTPQNPVESFKNEVVGRLKIGLTFFPHKPPNYHKM